MEKLYVRISQCLLFVFIATTSYSQEGYCAFNVLGAPKIENAGTIVKGDIITKDVKVILKPTDELILVDALGQLYQIKGAASTSYSEIANFKKEQDTDSFSKKYLSYVWEKFTKKSGKNDNIGAVYRNDYLYLQLAPSDSIKVYSPEINFSWVVEDAAETSFFLLKEKGSTHLTKLGIQGNTLHLFVDNKILVPGKQYEWAVSKAQFPDMDEVQMNSFFVLSTAQFNILQPEIEALNKDFTALGFSEIEIKKMICLDFKICY